MQSFSLLSWALWGSEICLEVLIFSMFWYVRKFIILYYWTCLKFYCINWFSCCRVVIEFNEVEHLPNRVLLSFFFFFSKSSLNVIKYKTLFKFSLTSWWVKFERALVKLNMIWVSSSLIYFWTLVLAFLTLDRIQKNNNNNC